MESLISDIRYGARMLWKSKALTAVAVISLAAGGLVALVACYVPARRAADVDPMVTLRNT